MYVKAALIGSKYWKQILIAVSGLFMIMFMFFFSLDEGQQQISGAAQVSEEVLRYQPLIEKYAAEYGVEDYINILLAKMQQESGGRGGDPMQSSESIGLPPNTIQDPEKSIQLGVKYFAQVLRQANGDILIALQSYNFGSGFIEYAQDRGGYSLEVAKSFSSMMAAKLGWPSYGDINYVPNVLRYVGGMPLFSSPNAQGFVPPLMTQVTSIYGPRIDPITFESSYHGGVDFTCNQQSPPIYAAKDGTVSRAGWENPSNPYQGFGQRIYIDHGEGVETVYAHLSIIGVQVGQQVKAGQVIGACGSTGKSTGNHLHLELHVNGSRVDPRVGGFY